MLLTAIGDHTVTVAPVFSGNDAIGWAKYLLMPGDEEVIDGVDWVVPVIGRRSREEALKWSRSALADIAKTAETQGLTICIEPTAADSNLVDSADDALTMMKEVAAPNVRLMFDTYHTIYRNEVASDYVHRFGKNLAHVHLADSNRLPPGEGTGEFPMLIEALKKAGFDGYLTMEIGFNRRDVDPDAFAKRAYDYVKRLIATCALPSPRQR